MKEAYQKLLSQMKTVEGGSLLLLDLSKGMNGKTEDLMPQIDLNGEILGDELRNSILLDGHPVMQDIDGRKAWIEPYYRRERILIFGGGHVALPLVKMAKILDLYIVVMDDREEFANKERFPEADEVFSGPYDECIRKIKPGKSDYCVIITRGHSQDEKCVRELLQYEESVYTGLIGSKKRTSVLLEQLAKEGKDPERLKRICTPIGLSIGAKTPAEIDIAILAEMIQRKRIESEGNTEVDRSDNILEVVETLVKEERPCTLAVILKAEGSAPRRAGAKMLVYEDGSIVGTVGGGSAEHTMIIKGQKMVGKGMYEIVDTILDGKDAMAEGMICGGKMKILLVSL